MTFTPTTKPAIPSVKKKFNAGLNLTKNWRWNWRPLRIRITAEKGGYRIEWQRWFKDRVHKHKSHWEYWRAYSGTGTLKEVIREYRHYAVYWRTGEY